VFERQAAAWPDSEFAHANLGLACQGLGRIEAAKAAYARALELAPTASWIWNNYGLLLKGSGEFVGAAAAFETAIAHESVPGESAGGTNLGVLYQRSGDDRGRDPIADLRHVLRQRPEALMARRLLLDALAASVRPSAGPAPGGNRPSRSR
jgi:Tfp pilus assembly protein PilF